MKEMKTPKTATADITLVVRLQYEDDLRRSLRLSPAQFARWFQQNGGQPLAGDLFLVQDAQMQQRAVGTIEKAPVGEQAQASPSVWKTLADAARCLHAAIRVGVARFQGKRGFLTPTRTRAKVARLDPWDESTPLDAIS